MLVGVEVLPEESMVEHVWRKQSIFTMVRGSDSYDKMRCERYDVTGKRHGLSSGVKRDFEYRAKKVRKMQGSKFEYFVTTNKINLQHQIRD